MHALRYLHLDVFTDRPFGGNQLAVFPDAAGLHPATMQRIAREFNFSETTFVLPAATPGIDAHLRIFTPSTELPAAGHPTVGTTFALAWDGVIRPGSEKYTFGLGVGPTAVRLDWQCEQLDFAWMRQRIEPAGAVLSDRPALAAALGLSTAALADGLPARLMSAGVPFLYVPLRSTTAVDDAVPDRAALKALFRAAGVAETPLFVFSTETGAGDHAVYSRMFAPTLGVAEDPATGLASGPLGVYLRMHGLAAADRITEIVSLQGARMGRPGRIHVRLCANVDGLEQVEVGGRAVLFARGELCAETGL